MRTILSNIRAHAGVTSVAVLGKRDGKIEHLFPAAFSDRHTERLLKLITSTYQRLRGFTRLSLRFQRVNIYLYNQPEYLLFVTVLPDTDMRQFNMVIQSRFQSIAQAITRRQAEANAARMRGSSNGADEPIHTMIDVLNDLSGQLLRKRGMVRLAADWRKARDVVATVHEPLTAVSIDAAGRFSVRKGRQIRANAETVEAFARLITQFLEELGTMRPEAEEILYSLLEDNREVLEPCGIFLFLNSANKKPVR